MAKRLRTSKGGATTPASTPTLTMAPAPAVASTTAVTADATLQAPGTGGVLMAPTDAADAKANGKVTRSLAARTRPSATTATPQIGVDSSTPKVRSKPSTPSANESSSKHVMLPAFLSKTFEIFGMPEFSSICGWNAAGDTIIVSQLEAFVARVLPRFFKHRNFPSFVRQLNLYGFHKTVLDSKRLEFQHPYFKRDRPDLLHLIKRKVSSGSGHQSGSTAMQNSRLDQHREISDTLVRDMKDLRQRSETMEKRLRELEVDNAIVRSDNVKLWKHLEAAKDKQLIMQEKMKKILWILFQMYRNKKNVPKLSSTGDDHEALSDESLLGPKEFREVLRFLAMDEPAMLPRSSSTDIDSITSMNNMNTITQPSRKRKFVEVPADQTSMFGDVLSMFEAEAPPVAADASDPAATTTLSIFTPSLTIPRIMPQGEKTTETTATQQDLDTDEQVMQKLEDLESSLLDEYDVGCLDTLLQQLGSTQTMPSELDDAAVGDVQTL